MFQRAAGLDMARGSLKTGGALVKTIVDMNVSKLPALEAGFIVERMVASERHIVIAACPLDFGMSDSDLFFLDKRR